MTNNKVAIIEEVEKYLPPEDIRDVSDALEIAQKLYKKCECHRGESCMDYVTDVASLLLPRNPDAHTLIACILQCANKMDSLNEIEKRFGKDIRTTIATLAMLEGECGTTPRRTMTQLKRMVITFSKNIRVLLIALHNTLCMLKRSNVLTQKEQRLLARESLEIFGPICARLGIYALKYELETLGFSLLHPEDAEELRDATSKLKESHASHLDEGRNLIDDILQKESIHSNIITRMKHPYSIFRKMNRKGISSPTELHDLFGIRILVESEEDCYRTLGMIHKRFRPIAHRMKDYIAMPKPNGYRSLHTTVLGVSDCDHSFPVEVQIRTKEMDEEAEYGIAAHWNYKEHGSQMQAIGKAWKQRLDKLAELGGAEEEDEEIDGDEIADRIYVITPKGDVVELRKSATPLDFAFRVHSDVGLRYRHASVNGKIAPIDYSLENGDVVDVQTWSLPRPSQQWIQIAITKHARQKLRSYFREVGEMQSPSSEKVPITHQQHKKGKGEMQRTETPKVNIESDTTLPYCFAKCCNPDNHSAQRPPIVGFVTQEGIIRIHWSGCRMIANANPERLIGALWAKVSASPSLLSSAA